MKRGAVIGWVAAAALVVAAGGVGAWWLVSSSSRGPEQVASEFMTAVSDGDGARALALVDAAPDATAHAAEALEGAADLVGDWQVEVDDDGDGTRADVTFDLDGIEHEASFALVEADGGWRVGSDALGSLTPATTIGDTVLIGGVAAPTGADTLLLPAVYTVAASPAAVLEGATTVTVLPGSRGEAAVEATITPEATAVAQQRLDEYADACAAPAAAVPENCGLRVPWAADLAALSSIAFRIDEYPAVALAPDGRSFDATGGVIVATASGQSRDGAAATFTYRADDWALRGDLDFTGGEMVLAVR